LPNAFGVDATLYASRAVRILPRLGPLSRIGRERVCGFQDCAAFLVDLFGNVIILPPRPKKYFYWNLLAEL
jgi:hypothetical protein